MAAQNMGMGKDDDRKVFVGGLPFHLSTNELFAAFVHVGHIEDYHIVLDRHTGKSAGYGFITFGTPAQAQEAITKMNGVRLHNRALTVAKHRQRPPHALPVAKPHQRNANTKRSPAGMHPESFPVAFFHRISSLVGSILSSASHVSVFRAFVYFFRLIHALCTSVSITLLVLFLVRPEWCGRLLCAFFMCLGGSFLTLVKTFLFGMLIELGDGAFDLLAQVRSTLFSSTF